MAATLGPNDNCQLWPEWQMPMCRAILIQTGNCQTGLRLAAAILGPVVAPNPVSQCAIARMATTGNCQSGARVAKICCVHDWRLMRISFSPPSLGTSTVFCKHPNFLCLALRLDFQSPSRQSNRGFCCSELGHCSVCV